MIIPSSVLFFFPKSVHLIGAPCNILSLLYPPRQYYGVYDIFSTNYLHLMPSSAHPKALLALFFLRTSVVSYSLFELSSSAAIVSSSKVFIIPYLFLQTSVVSHSFHGKSSSAAIVSPFIVRFTNELRLLFVL